MLALKSISNLCFHNRAIHPLRLNIYPMILNINYPRPKQLLLHKTGGEKKKEKKEEAMTTKERKTSGEC